jgi:hypothetical protein
MDLDGPAKARPFDNSPAEQYLAFSHRLQVLIGEPSGFVLRLQSPLKHSIAMLTRARLAQVYRCH